MVVSKLKHLSVRHADRYPSYVRISLPVLPPASRAMPLALAVSPLSPFTSPKDGVLDLLFCGSLLPIPFRKVAMCLLLLIRMRLWLYRRQWAALFVFGMLLEPREQCPRTGGICSQIKKAAIVVVKHSSVRSCYNEELNDVALACAGRL